MKRLYFSSVLLFFLSITGIGQENNTYQVLENILPKSVEGCKLAGVKQSTLLQTATMKVGAANAIYADKNRSIEIDILEFIDSDEAYQVAIKELVDIKKQNTDPAIFSLIDLSGKEGLIKKFVADGIITLLVTWNKSYVVKIEVMGSSDSDFIISVYNKLDFSSLK